MDWNYTFLFWAQVIDQIKVLLWASTHSSKAIMKTNFFCSREKKKKQKDEEKQEDRNHILLCLLLVVGGFG